MSEPKDDDSFLSRWSRRKIAAREGERCRRPSPPNRAGCACSRDCDRCAGGARAPPVESLEGLKSTTGRSCNRAWTRT